MHIRPRTSWAQLVVKKKPTLVDLHSLSYKMPGWLGQALEDERLALEAFRQSEARNKNYAPFLSPTIPPSPASPRKPHRPLSVHEWHRAVMTASWPAAATDRASVSIYWRVVKLTATADEPVSCQAVCCGSSLPFDFFLSWPVAHKIYIDLLSQWLALCYCARLLGDIRFETKCKQTNLCSATPRVQYASGPYIWATRLMLPSIFPEKWASVALGLFGTYLRSWVSSTGRWARSGRLGTGGIPGRWRSLSGH